MILHITLSYIEIAQSNLVVQSQRRHARDGRCDLSGSLTKRLMYQRTGSRIQEDSKLTVNRYATGEFRGFVVWDGRVGHDSGRARDAGFQF